jgi:CDP-diacylglycerol pyrophosphatase
MAGLELNFLSARVSLPPDTDLLNYEITQIKLSVILGINSVGARTTRFSVEHHLSCKSLLSHGSRSLSEERNASDRNHQHLVAVVVLVSTASLSDKHRQSVAVTRSNLSQQSFGRQVGKRVGQARKHEENSIVVSRWVAFGKTFFLLGLLDVRREDQDNVRH